jgi:hypothetical protein
LRNKSRISPDPAIAAYITPSLAKRQIAALNGNFGAATAAGRKVLATISSPARLASLSSTLPPWRWKHLYRDVVLRGTNVPRDGRLADREEPAVVKPPACVTA